jgi:3'-phosphoadenosine 5'-phosphosulfate sulfotransferase
MQKEIFKNIPGYEGLYQVSNLGNVKSLKYEKEKLLKPCKDTWGYYFVNLCKDRKRKGFAVHKLVAMTFLNHIPNGHKIVVDHINNIRTDNRLENLQIISARENISKDWKGNTSKYTGVSWHKRENKWKSQIQINGKRKHLGRFTNEFQAHEAYQKALNEYKLNNPI